MGLWRTDHAFVSTMHLKNVLTNAAISVTPILYSDSGVEYDLPAVQIPAAGIASVVVNDALKTAPADIQHRFGDHGSAALQYMHNGSGSVIASMQMLDLSASLDYAFPFMASMSMAMPMEHVMEGVWWKHDEQVQGHVALTNSSGDAVSATIQASGAGGSKGSIKNVRLAPHAQTIVELNDLAAAIPHSEQMRGGIQVRYTSAGDPVLLSGWLENAPEGYSARIPFSYHGGSTPPTPHTMASVGIMYGEQAPMPGMMSMGFPAGTSFAPFVELRNVTNHPLTISTSVLPGNGGVSSEKQLAPLTLAPLETRELDNAALAKALGDYMGTISLTFSFTGGVNDLLIASGAVDQTGNYLFQVDPGYATTSRSREVNFWSTKDGNDTMLTVWNPDTTPENLNLTLYFANSSGGTDNYVVPLALPGRGAANISIMQLIEAGTPDANGHTIPMTAMEGSLVISDPNKISSKVRFVASAGIFDAETATCCTTCWNCDGYDAGEVAPDPIALAMGDSTGATFTAEYSTGSRDDLTSETSWSSTNTSVATVDGTGSVAAVAPGTVEIDGFIFVPQPGMFCNGEYDFEGNPIEGCPDDEISGGASAEVLGIAITGADVTNDRITVALSGPTGTTGSLRITILGTGTQPAFNASAGVGSNNYSFNLGTIPIGEYTSISAVWTVSGTDFSASLSYHFKVLGTYRQTQYNVPSESQCSGTAQSITVWQLPPPSHQCQGTNTTVISGFDFRVTNPAGGTGSGHSINWGDVQQEALCSTGSGDLRAFATLSGTLGGLGDDTVAACPTSELYSAGQQVFIVGEGVKTVTDRCPACCSDGTHLDNFSTSTVCSGLTSLPNALTIRLFQ